MSLNNLNNIRGDTLVEVLFATAVFSLVAVGCLSIMNQGAATAQRSLEITLVRNEIDAQAETLRFLNASYISAYNPDPSTVYSGPALQWKQMQDFVVSHEDNITDLSDGCNVPGGNNYRYILNARKALYLNPTNLKPSAAKIFSRVVYDNDSPASIPANAVTSAEGIWIETSWNWLDDNVGYIDFHIRACWDSPGQTTPVTLGTIVRLYEPH